MEGWVSAAVEQRPDLDVQGYVQRRVSSAAWVTVGHADLLATFD
jgi:hypothetical protein